MEMSGYIFMIAFAGTVGLFTFLTVMALGFWSHLKRKSQARTLSDDEGQMLQEIWNGLQKMEDRIGNLETILLHREQPR